MSDPDFTHAVFLSRSPKDKAVVRVSSLYASNEERMRCRNDHSAVQPVAASRSAAFSAGRQALEQEDGRALPSRRYAGEKQVGRLLHLARGEKVLLDADLAVLYGVTTGALNRAAKRNPDRFPPDLRFQLTADEADRSRFQIGTLKRGQNLKYLPQAFTQEGVAILSSVLRSPRAVQVNIAIMPACSLSASNGERLGCRTDHFAVQPVTASRQSAAFSAGWQTREQRNGGALSSRRYATKIATGLEGAQPTFQPSAFPRRPHQRLAGAISLHQLTPSRRRAGTCEAPPSLLPASEPTKPNSDRLALERSTVLFRNLFETSLHFIPLLIGALPQSLQ